jgi:choline-sulfatase
MRFALVLRVTTVLCMVQSTSTLAQTRQAPAKAVKPNVLLITIDTVRADHLGCYGDKNIQTPTLDGLARDGIIFERALSLVPLTSPSHAAILTGTYPFQNGVQDFTSPPLDPRFRSVAQSFKQNGYATGAVVSAYVLDRTWGLARGFDFYDDAFSPETFLTKDIGLVDRKAEQSVNRSINWLSKTHKQTPRPFFFWLHLYDPHSPYDPPEPYQSAYRDRPYDGEIAYADHEIGRMISWLKVNHLYERTLVVVLSDHGESLGDHGENEHGFFVYNSTLRVPLIVKPPAGRGFQPSRISYPVETISVAPTLLKVTGVKDEIEKQFESPELLAEKPSAPVSTPLRAGNRSVYSETFYPLNSFGWSPLHSLQTEQYHFVDAPKPELYDVIADPQEKNNLAPQQNATVAVLKEKIQTLLRRNPYKAPADPNFNQSPDALEKLRALGYVAYRSPVSPEALAAGLPDPKDKLPEFNTILAAQDAFRVGNISSADALLEKVQREDPKMYIVPFMRGIGASKQKDWDRSAAELKRCLELNPNFIEAMTGLARALFFQGKYDEARQWAQNALKLNPQNYKALYELASIESHTDKAAAIADYEKAIAIQDNFAPLQRDLGMLYYEQQNYAAAVPHLAKATELGFTDARLLNILGICYDRIGRLQQSLVTYRQALKLDQNLPEAHLNLGFVYHRLHREDLASTEYQRACELKQEFCRLIPSQTQ